MSKTQKSLIAGLAAVLVAGALYSARYLFAWHEFCLAQAARCIRMKSGWTEVKIMSGRRTMVLHDRGFLGLRVQNDMDLFFLEPKEAERLVSLTRNETVTQHKFGRTVKISEQTFANQDFRVPGFFHRAVFVVDQAALIRCQELVCLADIEQIR